MSIDDFMEITTCDNRDTATKYLEISNFDLSRAIELFFETGGVLENDSEGADTYARSIPMDNETDEAMARRIQAEMDEQASKETIRAADAGYQDTLLGGMGIDTSHIDAQRQARHFDGFASLSSSQEDPRGLTALFAPPSYRFEGNLDDARETATEHEKLLMVSFNEPSDFRSHILNRDVWKKEQIEIIMQAFFVLLQVEARPMEGIADLYKVADIPSLIIIDPRTGRKIHDIGYDEFKDEKTAMATLLSFVEQNPLDNFYRKPEPMPQPPSIQSSAECLSTPVAAAATPISPPVIPTHPPPISEPVVDTRPVDAAEALKIESAHQSANMTLAQLHAERRKRAEEAALRKQ